MKHFIFTTLVLSCVCNSIFAQGLSKNKKAIINSIETHSEKLIALSDAIWAEAEIAFQETNSSKLLADFAEANGFKVTRGVANIPTAFTATYGSGSPVISILGEFDALPGLSQKAEPTKNPLNEGAGGHGCGHNLFGTGSLGAAIAIKELIENGAIKGTVKFLGTPAEEKFFGKLWMLEAGLWDDVDVNISWHPSAKTEADVQSSLALVDFVVEFYGQAAHAAADPWNGRSASDALELYTSGINFYREHIKPTVRIHYHIQDGGQVVNVVPDYSRLWVRVRNTNREGMMPVYEQVMRMAEGAAIMANVTHKVSLVSGLHEVLVNRAGGKIMQHNLELLGPINYTPNEIAFGKKIQEVTGKPQIGMDADIKPLLDTREHPGGGSTDVGDVSWVVPNINLAVTTAPKDTPWHSWAVVACGGMSIGHKGMIYAAKAMAATACRLVENQSLIAAARQTHQEHLEHTPYTCPIPDDVRPPV